MAEEQKTPSKSVDIKHASPVINTSIKMKGRSFPLLSSKETENLRSENPPLDKSFKKHVISNDCKSILMIA